MLIRVRELSGYDLAAHDGEIGTCKDFLFDDRHWTVRYMVADTGGWLSGRKVLVSPYAVGTPDKEARKLPLDLDKERVENAPPLAEHAPVSAQYEQEYAAYYGYPFYWGGPEPWGLAPTPQVLGLLAARERAEPRLRPGDQHLRSTKEVKGYRIAARDEPVGHVEDFLLESENWVVRYLVVDTRNWLPGRKVLLPPTWAGSVDWLEGAVHVDIPADRIRESPAYDPDEPVTPAYEARLQEHYGLPSLRL